MSAIPKDQLQGLKTFIEMCERNPSMLYLPELEFFKNYIESLGGKIPSKTVPQQETQSPTSPKAKAKPAPAPEPELETEESEESEIELDNTGVIEDLDDLMPEYVEEIGEITDEMMEESDQKRSEAMSAVSEGNLEQAISLYTEAVKMNPHSALLYAKRASVYIKMNKPKTAIHDCNKAIELNPDSAQPYKWRGKANRMLGNWELAYDDISKACKLDYDEESNALLKEVKPNAMKIRDHRRKYDRKREEKELKARQEKIKKAKEDQEQQRRQSHSSGGSSGEFPGGFPGAGGFPGGARFPGAGGAGAQAGFPDISSLLSDPDILEAFKDPEVSAAFKDVSQNPANISKYQSNPKIQRLIEKMSQKFGGSPGTGGI